MSNPILFSGSHYVLGTAFWTWTCMYLAGHNTYQLRGKVTEINHSPMAEHVCSFERNGFPVPNVKEDDWILKDRHACVMASSDLPRMQQRLSKIKHKQWPEFKWLHIQAHDHIGLIQLIAPRDQLHQARSWPQIMLRQMADHGYRGKLHSKWAEWVRPMDYVIQPLQPRSNVLSIDFVDLVHEGEHTVWEILQWFDIDMDQSRWSQWLIQYKKWSQLFQDDIQWLLDPQSHSNNPVKNQLYHLLKK